MPGRILLVDANYNPITTSNALPTQLMGSNFEQAIGSAIPANAVMLGLSDGANLQAMRGNTEGTLLASAARTTSTSSPFQTNYNAAGVFVVLNVTAASGTGGLTVKIWARDTYSSTSIQLNPDPTAITAIGRYGYMLYPGASASGIAGAGWVNQFIPAALPRTWYVEVRHGDTSSYTYSVSYALMV